MASNKSKGVAIFRVVSGNFLEMYDFMVYGFYATAIAKTFFPGDNPFASLMLSLATFGAGFLMRPLGAVFLGAYIDRHGRRQGLIITLGLMAMGTLLIAFVPGYATLGVAAPLLVLFGRLLQVFDRFAAEADEVAIALQVLTEPAAERVGPGLALEEAPGLVLGVVAFVEVGQQVLDGLGVAQLGVARVEHGRGAVGLLLDQVDDGVMDRHVRFDLSGNRRRRAGFRDAAGHAAGAPADRPVYPRLPASACVAWRSCRPCRRLITKFRCRCSSYSSW